MCVVEKTRNATVDNEAGDVTFSVQKLKLLRRFGAKSFGENDKR